MSLHWKCREHGSGEARSDVVATIGCPVCRMGEMAEIITNLERSCAVGREMEEIERLSRLDATANASIAGQRGSEFESDFCVRWISTEECARQAWEDAYASEAERTRRLAEEVKNG